MLHVELDIRTVESLMVTVHLWSDQRKSGVHMLGGYQDHMTIK